MPILFRRILIKVIFAASLAAPLLWFLLYGQVQASPQAQSDSEDCASCHADIQDIWYEGAHSAARTTHVLEQSMKCLACHPDFTGGQGIRPPAGFASSADGKMKDSNCLACHTTGYDPQTGKSKAYGVTCEACHTPVSGHPDKDISTNTRADLCGRCHSDTRFNWDNWQNSRHYQENMSCVECHDPHSASLHNVSVEPAVDKSGLCLSCHKPDEHMSPYSVHGRAGVTCVKCHLGEKRGVDAFHVVPNHSFKPEIETCSSCHAAALHRRAKPGESLPAAIEPSSSPTPHAAAPQPQETENAQPPQNKQPDSQLLWLAFAGVAGLIGLIIGAALPLLNALLKNRKSR